MPKVHHIQHARKDYPAIGVKKGEPYYRWSIKLQRGGLVRMSKTPPKPSQLTVSEFYSTLYALQEQTEFSKAQDFSELQSMRDEVVGELEQLRDEQQGKLDNMPEGLQQGSTGELLQERYDVLEQAVDELNGIDIPEVEETEDDDEDAGEEEGKADQLKTLAAELDGILQAIGV